MSHDDRLDEGLGAAYRSALPPTPTDRSECPAPEALERLADGTTAADERLLLLDHVMACSGCLPEFQMLRSIREAAATDEAGAGRVVRRPRRLPLAIAAGIAVLITSTLVIRSSGIDPVLRSGAGQGELVAPTGAVERPERLVWRSAGAEASYRVELLGADGALLFEAATADTTVALPPRLALSSGESYRWTVETVTLEGGARTAGPMEFRIR